MLANDARMLIRPAVATAVVGIVLIGVGAVVDGGKGALGAVLGVLLVAIFFTLSVVAVSTAGRRWGPSAMMVTALGTFLVKILVLLALIAAFRGTTAFNTRFFGLTAIICILAWNGGQVFALARSRIPYVVPETTPGAPAESTVPSAESPGAPAESTVPDAGHVSGES